MTKQSVLVLVVLLIVATACSALPGDEPGSIAMVPFSLPEMAIQGTVPSACPQIEGGTFACEALLPGEGLLVVSVSAAPVPREEMEDAVVQSLGLDALPDALGLYRGKALTWQVYRVDSELKDQGVPPPADGGLYRVEMALADSEGWTFLAAMITLPADREAHAAFFDTLFKQMLYTLAPLLSERAPQ
jgi:hypothetical protein